MSREIKIPGPDHPITITSSRDHVVVRSGEVTIADSRSTLVLREAGYAPVRYIPLADVDRSQLAASEHTTYCPYKGDASYYSIRVGDKLSENAIWSYEQPFPAVGEIAGRLAFYPSRVDAIES